MRKICSVGTNERCDFYDLWQQHKQLKTVDINEAWSDINEEEQMHQFQPELIHKIWQ